MSYKTGPLAYQITGNTTLLIPISNFYNFNEDSSHNDQFYIGNNTKSAELPFFDEPLDPKGVFLTDKDHGGYVEFHTSLVGVDSDPSSYKAWTSNGYLTNIDWKNNSVQGVSDVSAWGSGSPLNEPPVISGGIFGVQATDQATAAGVYFNPMPDSVGSPGQTIALTAVAWDSAEGRTLTYSLAPGSPSGASIDPATGSFTWTIPANEPPGDYPITIDVTDNASPPLTALTSFTIHVQAPGTQQTSSFSAVSGSGTFGGTATLTAALTSGGSPLAGEVVSFALKVNGSVTSLGTATTDANGIATLSNANIAGANVGTTPGAISVNFAGDATYLASSASGSLTVSPRDVSSQVSVTSSGLVYNRGTQQFGGTMTLTNTGTSALNFSFEVVLTNLPAGVTLANASGYTADGNPYILVDLPGGAWHRASPSLSRFSSTTPAKNSSSTGP